MLNLRDRKPAIEPHTPWATGAVQRSAREHAARTWRSRGRRAIRCSAQGPCNSGRHILRILPHIHSGTLLLIRLCARGVCVRRAIMHVPPVPLGDGRAPKHTLNRIPTASATGGQQHPAIATEFGRCLPSATGLGSRFGPATLCTGGWASGLGLAASCTAALARSRARGDHAASVCNVVGSRQACATARRCIEREFRRSSSSTLSRSVAGSSCDAR